MSLVVSFVVSINLWCLFAVSIILWRALKTHLTSVKVWNWMTNQPLSDISSLFLISFLFFYWHTDIYSVFFLKFLICFFKGQQKLLLFLWRINKFFFPLSAETDFNFFDNAICHLHSYVYLYLIWVLHWFCSQYTY